MTTTATEAIRLCTTLCGRAIPHGYRVRDGAHDWDYWRSGLPAVLGFVSTGFRQK